MTNNFEMPIALEKTGNFTQSGVTIYDPLTTRACTSADNCPSGVSQIRTPFAGNFIPASRINPIGQNIINVLPISQNPNAGAETIDYTGSDSLFDRADEYVDSPDRLSITKAESREATLWGFQKAAIPAPARIFYIVTSMLPQLMLF